MLKNRDLKTEKSEEVDKKEQVESETPKTPFGDEQSLKIEDSDENFSP